MTTKSCYYAGVLGSGMRISAQNLPKIYHHPKICTVAVGSRKYRSFGNGIFGSGDAQIVKPNKGMGVGANDHPHKIDN